MQKSIADMAKYIKDIIPSHIPKAYAVKPMFRVLGDDETIRNGVVSFRDFLFLVCDRLIADGHIYEKPPKPVKNNTHGVSLAACYPFINHVKNVLFNIGFHGKFNDTALLLDDHRQLTHTMGMYGDQQKATMTAPKVKEALEFLAGCGLYADDLKFSYPDDPDMLIGLKAMATAQRAFAVKGNNDAFLRCDYRLLAEASTDTVEVLKEYIRPLPDPVQDFVLKLHRDSIENGLTCDVDVFFLIVRLVYFYKKKEIWSFSLSVDSGFRILIKAQNTHQYAGMIEKFPLPLQEKIARGYGCDKKKFNEPCQKGCHGFSIALEDSVLDIRRDIEQWLDQELSYLK